MFIQNIVFHFTEVQRIIKQNPRDSWMRVTKVTKCFEKWVGAEQV